MRYFTMQDNVNEKLEKDKHVAYSHFSALNCPAFPCEISGATSCSIFR